MHPDIEKLISIAKENGDLTEKQREIILRKAEKLGEDVDEVELRLDLLGSSLNPKLQLILSQDVLIVVRSYRIVQRPLVRSVDMFSSLWKENL